MIKIIICILLYVSCWKYYNHKCICFMMTVTDESPYRIWFSCSNICSSNLVPHIDIVLRLLSVLILLLPFQSLLLYPYGYRYRKFLLFKKFTNIFQTLFKHVGTNESVTFIGLIPNDLFINYIHYLLKCLISLNMNNYPQWIIFIFKIYYLYLPHIYMSYIYLEVRLFYA